MGKETVVSEGEALGRELNSNHFLDLSLKPNSISIKELIETLIERIAEAREQSPSNQRKQRKSAIEQQRYILGRLISNFVYNHEKNVNYSFFVPVNKSIAFKKNDENINLFHNLQLKYVLDMLASNKLNLIKISKAKFKNNNSYFNECTIIKADIAKRINEVFEKLLSVGRIRNLSDFAENLGINRGTLTNYMQNKREPGIRLLITLKNTFDINSNWLLSGEGDVFLSNEFKRLENSFMYLEEKRKTELVDRSENLERENLELEKLKSTITILGYESEKRVIFEERAEGILRNLHAKRIEILGVKSRLLKDRKKRGTQKPLLTPAAIIGVENHEMINILNQQINDFVNGKSHQFKKLISQINNITID